MNSEKVKYQTEWVPTLIENPGLKELVIQAETHMGVQITGPEVQVRIDRVSQVSIAYDQDGLDLQKDGDNNLIIRLPHSWSVGLLTPHRVVSVEVKDILYGHRKDEPQVPIAIAQVVEVSPTEIHIQPIEYSIEGDWVKLGSPKLDTAYVLKRDTGSFVATTIGGGTSFGWSHLSEADFNGSEVIPQKAGKYNVGLTANYMAHEWGTTEAEAQKSMDMVADLNKELVGKHVDEARKRCGELGFVPIELRPTGV